MFSYVISEFRLSIISTLMNASKLTHWIRYLKANFSITYLYGKTMMSKQWAPNLLVKRNP
uniref:Uncharacterized protein n=1 Tax=Arundo donax TaxID=35708 RepID=A0A0A8ZJ61_ARUDO